MQRVARAQVKVGRETAGRIGPGLLIFLGVGRGDTPEQARRLADKIASLRIFGDENGKMNLFASRHTGGSPGGQPVHPLRQLPEGPPANFRPGRPPETARELYHRFKEFMAQKGLKVQSGQYAAHMTVELINDGPVTLMLEIDGETFK